MADDKVDSDQYVVSKELSLSSEFGPVGCQSRTLAPHLEVDDVRPHGYGHHPGHNPVANGWFL